LFVSYKKREDTTWTFGGLFQHSFTTQNLICDTHYVEIDIDISFLLLIF
jgi:hypothetical protein